jgi:YidC/Oxa1 family membrane protein insertase
MGDILNFLVYKPFSWILLKLYLVTGSYGLAILLFCLVIKLIFLPISAKSKRGMMQTSRIQPKITEIQKRYKDNKQKQQEEMAKLYQDEGVNPMGGCLWSLLPLPIFFALYGVLQRPLEHLMGLTNDQINAIAQMLNVQVGNNGYIQITLAQLIHQNFQLVSSQIKGLIDIDFMFLGINLAEIPKLSLNCNYHTNSFRRDCLACAVGHAEDFRTGGGKQRQSGG